MKEQESRETRSEEQESPEGAEGAPVREEKTEAGTDGTGELSRALDEANDKYLRLYAEFDNFKKRVGREREETLKYGNESLLYELLPAIDHLELALKHASRDTGAGLVQGVEMTLKELYRTLEKFGLTRIEAAGKCFDPAVHHAMVQVEREDMDDRMVAEELRAGFLYRDKVLRPSLVAVSMKPKKTATNDSGNETDTAQDKETKEIKEEEC